jgi:hypothetical protein
MPIDSVKINRLADSVNSLTSRFDAMARKDAKVSPSEYKALVKARDEALQDLIDFREANANGATWNLGVFERKYTAACNALANAQIEMSKSKWDK